MRASDAARPRARGRDRVRTTALAALTALGCLAAGSAAGEDAERVGREREALRRAQAALRQAQDAQSALAQGKAELTVQRDQSVEAAKRTSSQLAASRTDAARRETQAAQLQAELDAARTQLAKTQAQADEASARADDVSRRLAQADRTVQERSRANAALTALIEHASRSLAAAEQSNRQMYALGRQMIDQLRGGQPAWTGTSVDPVLGFDRIRIENKAEALRDQLEATKLPTVGTP